MTEPNFHIHQEGRGVVITGEVPVSQQRQQPYLERVPESDPTVRVYRVDYHQLLQGESETGRTMETIEYHEPELGGGVKTLRFRLGDDREISISSHPEPVPAVDPRM
jgi:hypothetical protein